MIEPPDHNADWLWGGLRNGGRAQVVVLGADYPDQRVEEGWEVDALINHSVDFDHSEMATLSAIALLSVPAARRDIEIKIGQTIHPWIEKGMAEFLVNALSSSACAEAHRLAYTFLDGEVVHRKLDERPREDILRARWHHAQAAGWTEAILEGCTNLLRLYREQSRAAAYLGILETAVSLQRNLPDDTKIGAAWAYLVAGMPKEALDWLTLLKPGDLEPVDEAEWYSLRAEIEKSGRQGSKEAAKSFLNQALSALAGESGESIDRQRLICRHELARLTHFFERDPAAAIEQYEQVEQDWQTVRFADLERAITIRNLAEAMMDCRQLDDAESCITKARALIPTWTQHPVVAELEYLSGRLAIRCQLHEKEIIRRFQICLEKARLTNHLVMVVIVEVRLFWCTDLGQESATMFDDTKWGFLSGKLTSFERHNWVARVFINGRLRAARRLSGRGELSKARLELIDALRLIDASPDFDQGDDRRRIVVLYAGLNLYDGTTTNWWDLLKER
jgi:tetratricopeptide (TPR) repeat protein